jgi:pyridoxal 5-phosphate dependent beta-lyase
VPDHVETALASFLADLTSSVLSYDPDSQTLTYRDEKTGSVRAQVTASARAVERWLARFEDDGREAFGDPDGPRAAVRLALVDIEEDLDTGRDPFAALRQSDDPPPPRFGQLLHLQAAACSRPSPATLQAEIAYLHLEVEKGGYVAEGLAEETVDGLRAGLAELVGTDAEGVALVDSATSALAALLAAWPLPDTGRVGLAPSEWGPNVLAFERRDLKPVWLEVDGHGRLDIEALDRRLREDPPDLVQVTQVAAHRGLAQPVAEALEVCRRHGVPLWVDAAQAAGHVECAYGADAVYAPGRKWLRGPRGVGFVAVAEPHRATLRGGIAGLKPDDAHVAGRIGLAAAVGELLSADPASVFAALAKRGAALRAAVAEVPGWTVADAPDTDAAIVSLRPTGGADVATVKRRLYERHAILATASEPWRAPRDMTEPLLRFAPHLDVTDADIERLAGALASV